MRAKLAFSASLGIPATTYLADDKLSAGDDRFREKCEIALLNRLQSAGLIFVASNPNATKDVCEKHGVVTRGKIVLCGTHAEAKELFESNFSESFSDDLAEEDLPSFDLA